MNRLLERVGMPPVVVLFFAVLLITGIAIHSNYGISWDEKTQHIIGMEAYNTVFNGAPLSTDGGRRFHGAWLELVLYTAEQALPITTAQGVYFMRHLLSFLLYFVGTMFFYALAKRHFGSWKWGLLACAILVVHPRIFAHSFFNTRDIPTMVMFIIATYTLVRFVDRPSLSRALWHGLASGLLMGLRMPGLLIPAMTGLFVVLTIITTQKAQWRTQLKWLALYGLSFIAVTIACWPLLWSDPIGHFLDAYQNMSNKNAGGFYLGKKYETMPWHWPLVWMTITTPLLYIGSFLLGQALLVQAAARNRLQLITTHRNQLIFLLWFWVPVGLIVFGSGTIFDTWRHLFFVYPALVLLAVEGIRWLQQRLHHVTLYRVPLVTAAVLFSLCITGLRAARAHPVEYVYFSIPKQLVVGNFALDYWGLGYKKALEYITKHTTDPNLAVHMSGSAGFTNINILSAEERDRLALSNGDNMRFFIDDFAHSNYEPSLPSQIKIFELTAYGMNVMSVYEIPNWDPSKLAKTLKVPAEHFIYFFGKTAIESDFPDEYVELGDQAVTIFYVKKPE